VREDGSVVEGRFDREQAILEAHFPAAPLVGYEPRPGGRAFEKVDTHLVGTVLGRASNASAPGDDRISAGIVKIFWH